MQSTDRLYHAPQKPQLVFRAVGPAKEVIETVKLRILEQGNPTVKEMQS